MKQWAAMLAEKPRGVGPTIEDRQTWQTVAASDLGKKRVQSAKKSSQHPIAPLSDDLYLTFFRTGNRTRCEHVLSERRRQIWTLVLAECIENRRQFLPAIEDAIRITCSEKAWCLPAHDKNLENFHGACITIDLASSALSWNLATIRYWLGDRLSPDVQQLIQDQLERRTFAPFVSIFTEKKTYVAWWITGQNNWKENLR